MTPQVDNLKSRLEAASQKMYQFEPINVVDGAADCVEVIEELNVRLYSGEKP